MQIPVASTLASLSRLQTVDRKLQRSLATLSEGQRIDTPTTSPVRWMRLQHLQERIDSLNTADESLSRAATTVRLAQTTIDLQADTLGRMRTLLDTARAEPEGSPARADALAAFAELRQQLEGNLKVPDEGARQLLAPAQGEGSLRFSTGVGSYTLELEPLPIGPGAEGLDIPLPGDPLPSDPAGSPLVADVTGATDGEIDAMIENLTAAQEQLQARREGVANYVGSIERAAVQNTASLAYSEQGLARLQEVDLNAEAMLVQSLNLRTSLAVEGLNGMEETRNLTLRLLSD
ncbi:hypothetical protein H5P28_12030 [Ruficoccus amylovorans]|uniref:Flagellin N-terminal domain-containing protein n=1 Tax=Ruficoccus amylovorans TaxID=1804625 RepID=A0A842HH87_9BACT|nr:hypothetical protein [Ruficoccus amylovorans]MBC2594986.1 hypothetical protein [Ruficoccus amylovorans]